MLNLPLSRELLLDRPIAECYRYLADFSTAEQWDPGVFEARKTTPGAPQPGSEFELRLNVLGRSVPAHYRLVDCEAPRRLVLHGEGDGFSVVDRLEFEVLSATRTRLRYSVHMRWSQAPVAMGALLKPWAGWLADQAMTGLRRALVEDGPESPSALVRIGECAFRRSRPLIPIDAGRVFRGMSAA